MDSNKFFIVNYTVLFLLLIFNVTLALYNLGFFNISGADYDGGGIAKGFNRLNHPDSAFYRNNSVTASFTNPYEQEIKIINVSAHEYVADEDCSVEAPNGVFPVQTAIAGGPFSVSLKCPEKSDGESYDLAIDITYSVLFSHGTEHTYIDHGFIRGQGLSF
jgi:hypothetical protein